MYGLFLSNKELEQKVARAGLEPARHYWQGILSPQRLPIPPPSHKFFDKESQKKAFSGALGKFLYTGF